jgi:hypothetical protein
VASKTDFTEEEWNDLHRGATGAGMLVAISERGFTSTFKETSALAKFLVETRSNSASQVVREVAAEHGTGWKVSSAPEEVRDGTVAALKGAVAALQAKSPDDVEPYREFVVGLSHAVSDAAKGGDDVEAAAIVTITEALSG